MFKSIAQWFRRQIRRGVILLVIALVGFAGGAYSYHRFTSWQQQIHAADLKNGDVIEITSIGTNQDFSSGPVNYLYAIRLRDDARVNVPTDLVTSEMVANYKSGSNLILLDGELVSATITKKSAHAALPPNMTTPQGVTSKKGAKKEKEVSVVRGTMSDEVPFERN